MKIVNIREAKTHLSKLVEQAANGEPFIIAKAGKPLGHFAGCFDRQADAAFGLSVWTVHGAG